MYIRKHENALRLRLIKVRWLLAELALHMHPIQKLQRQKREHEKNGMNDVSFMFRGERSFVGSGITGVGSGIRMPGSGSRKNSGIRDKIITTYGLNDHVCLNIRFSSFSRFWTVRYILSIFWGYWLLLLWCRFNINRVQRHWPVLQPAWISSDKPPKPIQDVTRCHVDVTP